VLLDGTDQIIQGWVLSSTSTVALPRTSREHVRPDLCRAQPVTPGVGTALTEDQAVARRRDPLTSPSHRPRIVRRHEATLARSPTCSSRSSRRLARRVAREPAAGHRPASAPARPTRWRPNGNDLPNRLGHPYFPLFWTGTTTIEQFRLVSTVIRHDRSTCPSHGPDYEPSSRWPGQPATMIQRPSFHLRRRWLLRLVDPGTRCPPTRSRPRRRMSTRSAAARLGQPVSWFLRARPHRRSLGSSTVRSPLCQLYNRPDLPAPWGGSRRPAGR